MDSLTSSKHSWKSELLKEKKISKERKTKKSPTLNQKLLSSLELIITRKDKLNKLLPTGFNQIAFLLEKQLREELF